MIILIRSCSGIRSTTASITWSAIRCIARRSRRSVSSTSHCAASCQSAKSETVRSNEQRRNDTFEYDVEINDGFVTLSETSEDATVLIINTSRKEEPEPTAEPVQEPTEAPAEPTQAPQITQQPEDRAVTTNGVKTGDDSPLTQLAFMLFAASAGSRLIIYLNKKDKEDIME